MSVPVRFAFYLHNDQIFKVTRISRGTDEVFIQNTVDNSKTMVRYSVFSYGYERVFKMKDVASFVQRHPRSIYRYEFKGLINKPKCFKDIRGRMVRYYRMTDVLEMHDLISQIHQGHPRRDSRATNNTILDQYELKQLLKERYR